MFLKKAGMRLKQSPTRHSPPAKYHRPAKYRGGESLKYATPSASDFPSSQLKSNYHHNLHIRRFKARTWHNNRLYVWPLLTTQCSSVLLYRSRHMNDSDGTESGGSRYSIGHSLSSRRFLA